MLRDSESVSLVPRNLNQVESDRPESHFRNMCANQPYVPIPLPTPVVVWPLSRIWLLATPCTVAHRAPLSMGFSRPEYWSGLPFPSLGDLPYSGIEPGSPALQGDSLPSEPWGKLFAKGFGWVKPVKVRFHPGRDHWPRCRCQGDQRSPLAQDVPGFSTESPHAGTPLTSKHIRIAGHCKGDIGGCPGQTGRIVFYSHFLPFPPSFLDTNKEACYPHCCWQPAYIHKGNWPGDKTQRR